MAVNAFHTLFLPSAFGLGWGPTPLAPSAMGSLIGSTGLMSYGGEAAAGLAHVPLEGVADEIVREDPLGMRRAAALRIVWDAESRVRHGLFHPENLVAGETPTSAQLAAMAETALRQAYRDEHGTAMGSAELGDFLGPFVEHLSDQVRPLGLIGTKPVTFGKGGRRVHLPDVQVVASRVIPARKLLERIADEAPSDDIRKRVIALRRDLDLWGKDEDSIAKNLARLDARAAALKIFDEASALEKRADLESFERTHAFDWARGDLWLARLNPRIDAWIAAQGASALPDRAQLAELVRTYVAIWSAERVGVGLDSLTHSQSALTLAILVQGRRLSDPAKVPYLENFGTQLIHALVREEARQGRMARVSERGSIAPQPLPRAMDAPQHLQDSIGADLYGALNDFYEAIHSGARAGQANAFYELFVHYIRYAADAYGTDLRGQLLSRGLAPPLLRAIFFHVDRPERFDRDVLEVFRDFFAAHINPTVPPLAELEAQRVHRQARAGEERPFLTFRDGMNIGEFFRPLRMDAARKRKFEERVGMAYAAFEIWGTERAEAKVPEDVEVRPEDKTTEPTKTVGLNAILPAYHYMQEVAAEQGLQVDVMDYLAAIYPIARRVRAHAGRDGRIRIVIPEFMRELRFSNWGYSTWAQQIYGVFDTDVLRATIRSHMDGRVENPKWWDIRRYIGPIVQAIGGGAEQAEALYEFAWLMRVAHVLDNALVVVDSNESVQTNPSLGAVSRFQIQLIDDDIEYIVGAVTAADSRWQVFADARTGVVQRELDALGVYLRSIAELPSEVSLTSRDGETLSLEALQHQYKEMVRQHLIYSAALADRSPLSAHRSQEDRQAMYDFYLNLRRFMRQVTYEIQVRGSLETPEGVVRFQTMPRAPGHVILLVGGEHVTVLIDDVATVAAAERWDAQRTHDVLRIRIFMAHAAATGAFIGDPGNPAAIRRGIAPLFPADAALSDQAIADYLRLEGQLAARGHAAALPRPLPSGGDAIASALGPVLPLRRGMGGWQQQFLEHAGRMGIYGELASRGVTALEKYFQTIQRFYQFFWPETLRRIIRAHAPPDADGVSLYRASLDFFPTIGIAAEERADRILDRGQNIDRQLAGWATEDYLALLGGDGSAGRDPIRVPVNLQLLGVLVQRHLEEHRGADIHRAGAMAMARAMVGEWNSQHQPATWESSPQTLATHGLLRQRLQAFADEWMADHGGEQIDLPLMQRAYYRLLPHLRHRRPIAQSGVEGALREARRGIVPSPAEVDFLTAFMAYQERDVGHALNYLNESSGPVQLARAVAIARVTEQLPFDVAHAARDVVDPQFASYDDVVAWFAQRNEHIAVSALAGLVDSLRSPAEDARTAVELAAEEREEPAASYDAFVQAAATQLGQSSFVAAIEIDEAYRMALSLIGGPLPAESLEAASRRIYREQVVPNRKAYEAFQAAHAAELARIASESASLQVRAATLSAEVSEPRDVDAMTEAAAEAVVSRMEAGAQTAVGIRSDLRSLMAAAATVGVSSKKTEEAVHRNLSQADRAIASTKASAEARVDFLRHEAFVSRLNAQMGERTEAIQRWSEQVQQLQTDELQARTKTEAPFAALRLAVQTRGEQFASATAALTVYEHALADLMRRSRELGEMRARLQEGSGDDIGAEALLAAARATPRNEHETEILAGAAAALTAAAELLEPNRALIATVAGTMARSLGELRTSLAEAEGRLAPAEEWSLSENRALVDSETIQVEGRKITFSRTLPSKDRSSQIVLRLRPFLEDSRTLHLGQRNILISRGDAERVEVWRQAGRRSNIAVSDLFGGTVQLEAGRYGVVVEDHHVVGGGGPFWELSPVLGSVIEEPGPEVELIYRLTITSAVDGRGEEGKLLRCFLSLLARAGMENHSDELRRIIRRFALTYHDELIAALNSPVKALFVEEGNGTAAARGVRGTGGTISDPAVWTAERSAEEANALRTILADPRLTIVEIRPQQTLRVDQAANKVGVSGLGEHFVVSVDEAKRFGDGKERYLQAYGPGGEKRERLDARKLGSPLPLLMLEDRDFERPRGEMQLRADYAIHADPTLRELGWLRMRGNYRHETALLLQPFKATPPSLAPPFTLAEAQEMAVELWQQGDAVTHLFAETDRAVADEFPEVALVGVHAKLMLHRKRSKGEKAEAYAAAMEAHPDIAGIIPLLHRAGIEVSGGREEIIAAYRANRSRVQSALSRNARGGLSNARALTGFDRPWDVRNPDSWDNFSSLDRLRMMLPEVFKANPNDIENVTKDYGKVEATALIDFNKGFRYFIDVPEFRSIVFFDILMIGDFSVITPLALRAVQGFYVELGKKIGRGEKIDQAYWFQRFAEVHAEVSYVTHVRTFLQLKYADATFVFRMYFKAAQNHEKKTVAELLTGSKEPWLPIVTVAAAQTSPEPQRARPARALSADKRSTLQAKRKLFVQRLASRSSFFYDRPASLLSALFVYRVLLEPDCEELASFLLREPEKSTDRTLDMLLNASMRPFVEDLTHGPQALSLAELQVFWLDISERYRADAASREAFKRSPLFLRPGSISIFPELDRGGAWQMQQVLAELKANPVERMPSLHQIIESHPSMGGIAVLLAASHHLIPDEDKEKFRRAVAAVWRSDRMTLGGFYARHREMVKRALAERIAPNMTRAQWLTGVSEPWKPFPQTWDEVPAELKAKLLPKPGPDGKLPLPRFKEHEPPPLAEVMPKLIVRKGVKS